MSGTAGFAQILVSSRSSSSIRSSFTTAVSAINATDVLPIPANYLARDTVLRFNVVGALGNTTGSPTFTFQFMYGTSVMWSSGALTCVSTANTALPFTLNVDLRLVTEGPGTQATMLGVGVVNCLGLLIPASPVPVTSPTVGAGFDSTASANIDFQVACSASSASNTFQVHNYIVEQLRYGN